MNPESFSQHDASLFRNVMFTRLVEMLLCSKRASSDCTESGDVVQWTLCDNCVLPLQLWGTMWTTFLNVVLVLLEGCSAVMTAEVVPQHWLEIRSMERGNCRIAESADRHCHFSMHVQTCLNFTSGLKSDDQKGDDGQLVSLCQISWLSVTPLRRYSDFVHFQDGGRMCKIKKF